MEGGEMVSQLVTNVRISIQASILLVPFSVPSDAESQSSNTGI